MGKDMKLYIQVSFSEYKRLYKFLSGQALDEKAPGFLPYLYIKDIPIITTIKGKGMRQYEKKIKQLTNNRKVDKNIPRH